MRDNTSAQKIAAYKEMSFTEFVLHFIVTMCALTVGELIFSCYILSNVKAVLDPLELDDDMTGVALSVIMVDFVVFVLQQKALE